jgi:hypothetical protein
MPEMPHPAQPEPTSDGPAALYSGTAPSTPGWCKMAQEQPQQLPGRLCVARAASPGGEIAARTSRDPAGLVFISSHNELSALIAGIEKGQFDDLPRADNVPVCESSLYPTAWDKPLNWKPEISAAPGARVLGSA